MQSRPAANDVSMLGDVGRGADVDRCRQVECEIWARVPARGEGTFGVGRSEAAREASGGWIRVALVAGNNKALSSLELG